MNEKVMRVIASAFCAAVLAGCRTAGAAGTGPVDYIQPPTVEAAQYGIDERIAALGRELAESRERNGLVAESLERVRSEISGIRESGEAIIMAGRRSGDLIQETLELAEALDRWVNWALSRIAYLEALLEEEI